MFRQGKCVKCRVVVEWPGNDGVRLKDAACPKCGTRLQATTYLKKWPRVKTWGSHVLIGNVSFKKNKNLYPYPDAVRYRLTKDGEEKLVGSEQDCWNYIHRETSSSVYEAIKFGGWWMEGEK